MKKKILMLGGAYSQIPAIQYARAAGYHVMTCDYLPDNPGHLYAHQSFNVSTTDKEKVLQLAREMAIDGIVAYASDPSAPAAAYVCDALKLPGAFLDYSGFMEPPIPTEYFYRAYYSPLGTTPDQLAAWPLDLSGPQSGMDITLLRNNIDISGQVILPDDAMADQPIEIMIEVRSENDTYITLDHYVLEAGQNSLDFSIRVPENQQNIGYKLCYYLQSESDDYYRYGNYAGADATADPAKAATLDISGGHLENLVLPLIKSQSLSGQIKLDQGAASAEGAAIAVFAHMSRNSWPAASGLMKSQ